MKVTVWGASETNMQIVFYLRPALLKKIDWFQPSFCSVKLGGRYYWVLHTSLLPLDLLLLLLSHVSRVRLCATPETAAHQGPPSLGFSRQEHWSGLPFPSPMYESEK